MATILLTWELGGGLGHVVPLSALADGLSARGHQVVMALRDLSANTILERTAASVLQAPTPPDGAKRPIEPPYTYAHLLYNCGFDGESALRLRARSWLTLFDYVRPDIVLLDHSPTALLALRATSLLRVPIGVGFSIPVDEYPLRSTRDFPPANPEKRRTDEDSVTRRINQVLDKIGGAPIDRIGQLFTDADDRFLATYQELDPHQDRPEVRYWGALARPAGWPPPWPEAAGPRIFCYLKPFPGISVLLGLLKEMAAPTVIVGDGLDPTFAERFGGANIRFEPAGIDIAAAARGCDAAILNANHGTTAMMLLAGKPVLMLPLTQEHFMTAVRVERLGAGIAVASNDVQELQASLQAVLNLANYRRRAEQFAARYAPRAAGEQMEAMVDRIEELLRGR